MQNLRGGCDDLLQSFGEKNNRSRDALYLYPASEARDCMFNVALTCVSMTVAQFQINGSVQKGRSQRAASVSSVLFTGWGISAGVDLTGGALKLRMDLADAKMRAWWIGRLNPEEGRPN